MTINAILVPKGAEYKAVCRGLQQINASNTPVFAIPMGVKPVTEYLEKWLKDGHLSELSQPKVLLMGICGSLSPRYSVGDVVLYENCVYKSADNLLVNECDRAFTDFLYANISHPLSKVSSLTRDRLISLASEKQDLGKIYNADVVDMEGFPALKILNEAGFAVAMLRVISDDCQQDIPDLSTAFSPDGSLKILPLAVELLRHPIAAIRLIKSSLIALKDLQKVSACLRF